MRAPRRFRPAFDSLQDRIVPSTIAPAPTTTTTLASTDETGSPTDDPSLDHSYPIYLAPPPSTPNPITTLC